MKCLFGPGQLKGWLMLATPDEPQDGSKLAVRQGWLFKFVSCLLILVHKSSSGKHKLHETNHVSMKHCVILATVHFRSRRSFMRDDYVEKQDIDALVDRFAHELPNGLWL